jgi:hypothetical protein
MLSCMVDGQAHDIMASEGERLGSVIGTLNSEVAKRGRFIAALKVNGEDCALDSENCADRTLAEIGRLDVTTESSVDLALETLAEGGNYLGELRSFLLQTADSYRAGDETKGKELFVELINGLEWFVKIALMAELHLQVDFAETFCAGRTLTESVERFNRILLEIIAAQEQRDWVLLTDLLEYELAPQLELWREIFAMLRSRGADPSGETLRA